jgi:hypothetical protein
VSTCCIEDLCKLVASFGEGLALEEYNKKEAEVTDLSQKN